MPSDQIEQIKDTRLRELMQEATTFLDEGKNYDCVRKCADAYLLLLKENENVKNGLSRVIETERVKAGLERGMIRFAPLMWPRLAAKLHFDEQGEPTIVFDREHIGFGETIQYYEFTLNLIVQAETGSLASAMAPGGGGGLG
jgi:hypothetical protein